MEFFETLGEVITKVEAVLLEPIILISLLSQDILQVTVVVLAE